MDRNDCLTAARRIGERLADQARWSRSTCTWEVNTFDRSDPNRSKRALADGLLYQGTSGIAWFLAGLAWATGQSTLTRVATGALRLALRSADDLGSSAFGFHSGRVGIAWSAARAANLLARPALLDASWRVLSPLQGNEEKDAGLDVIAGAAGAIPALIDLSRLLDREEALIMAIKLGDHLIAQAHKEPDGWSWPMMTNTVARHLTGLAHGTSGAGLALMELAHVTGMSRFRFAADMAFLYERSVFDPVRSIWPDFRNMELSDYTFYEGRGEALLVAAREGSLPPYRSHSMNAWCHGAPGIGLARLRAAELTGADIYRREAIRAVDTTAGALSHERFEDENFSLCHGIAGNAYMLLLASEVLDRPVWRAQALSIAEQAWETFERAGRSWRCGTIGSVTDPSLMLGEAGIGSLYLGLACPEIAHPLLLRPKSSKPTQHADQGLKLRELARSSADEYFVTSRRAIESLTDEPLAWSPWSSDGGPPRESPARGLRAALADRVTSSEGAMRTQLEDAFRLDRERFDATCAIEDFSDEFVRGLIHRPWSTLDLDQDLFARAPDSRSVTIRWDWQAWNPDGTAIDSPVERLQHVLLIRERNRIEPKMVGGFAMLIFEVLERPASISTLVRRVAVRIEGQIDPRVLTTKVVAQMEAFYRVGYVVDAASTIRRRSEAPARAEGR